jgi:anaerobic selenocysteine-containing dehydrogenase
MLDLGLRTGPYGSRLRNLGRGLRLKALEDAPHGIDLGPLQPCLPGKLYTKDKRMDLAPAPLMADVARLERERLGASAPPAKLELIGRRELRTNNSWLHNSARLVKGPPRCTLQMHPIDARARGLVDGRNVVVTSRVGSVTVLLDVTDEVMPGVVSLPHGWGHGRPGVRLGVAQAHAGASINDLTDEERVDLLSGNASFSGVVVEVVAADTTRVEPATHATG